jgi:hypothetical protein
MDHIEALPVLDSYDSILIIVCRLTKQVIFKPMLMTHNAHDLATTFMMHVFSKHGLPADIISDCSHLFVSKFWTSLCKALDISANLSMAYHPKTNGQTEHVNQILKQYLQIYTNYHQDNWAPQLPIMEFMYNNTPHSATGVSPFFTNKGYYP